MVKMIDKKDSAGTADVPDTGVESLADIAKLGANLELQEANENSAVEAKESQQQQADNAAELHATLTVIRGMVLPILPDYKRTIIAQAWTDDALKNISTTGAAVLDKHGINLGDVMGGYAVYIALAAALAPPVLVTVQAMKLPPPKEEKPNDGQQQQA